MIEYLPALVGAAAVGVSLGLLGSGGSILCVPLLVYAVGRPDKQAIVESLAIVGLIALFGGLRRARAGQVAWRVAGVFAISTIPAAIAGAALGRWVPGAVQIVALAVVMLTSAGLMLRPGRGEEAEPRAASPLRLGAAGLGVGLVTGFVGVGGGFLIVPALMLFAGLGHRRAVGTSLIVIAINAAAGFAKYRWGATGVPVDGVTIAIFAVCGAAGSVLGQRLGSKLNQRTFKRVFAVFLLVLGGWMLVDKGAELARRGEGQPPEPASEQS